MTKPWSQTSSCTLGFEDFVVFVLSLAVSFFVVVVVIEMELPSQRIGRKSFETLLLFFVVRQQLVERHGKSFTWEASSVPTSLVEIKMLCVRTGPKGRRWGVCFSCHSGSGGVEAHVEKTKACQI